MERADLVIVGGGAAGLAAAIFAAEAKAGRRIVVLEGSKQFGTKILVSGGGRCNVTHKKVMPEDFCGSRNIVRNVLAALPVAKTIQWFASLGVELKEEPTGKLFPVSDSAHTVLDALIGRCRELGIELRTNCRVGEVVREDGGFLVRHAQGVIASPRMILATGGRSLPKSGSDGSGWQLAARLGHTVTPTYQALVPLVLEGGFFHSELSGIALDVGLTTSVGGKPIDTRTGALLFTHFGVSGPVVMDASRHWVMAQESGGAPALTCNLLAPDRFEQVEQWLVQMTNTRPRLLVNTVLAERLPERVAQAVARHAGVEAGVACGGLSREARRELVHALVALPLPVVRPRGWEFAEVTAGGVPLNEIDFRTMESRKVPGLQLIGEILDCDGRIGGFNFQWAWAGAKVAGSAAIAGPSANSPVTPSR